MADKIYCDSCKKHEKQWELRDVHATDVSGRNVQYNLCGNCLNFIVNNTLTSEHFANLINAGHSISEFLLHGDFYTYELEVKKNERT